MMTPIENQSFKPFKPEKTVDCTITKREAIILSKLRRFSYGKFIIHKANGILIRVETNDSQLIDEDTEVNLD